MFTLKKDIPQLYQWDSNVKLIVEDDRINQVQFSQRFSRTAVCVKVENGECFIPNELLQSYCDIFAYACIVDNDGQVCEFSEMFTVFARSKPDNYIYTPTEIITFKRIEDELNKKFEALAKEIEDDMKTAVRTRPQELTEEEKSQARKNIGAISSEEDRGAYYVTITEDENGYISDRTFDDISHAINNNLFPYVIYNLSIYPWMSIANEALVFGGILDKSFTEIKIMSDNNIDINSHNYSPDWEDQEYDDGFIKNRTHGKIVYKCDTEEKVPTSILGARELTDSQETYLQSIGANTESSKELSFVLPGYDVFYDRMSNEYDYDNYEPPNESNTKIQIAIQDSSGIITANPSFTVSEIKTNDIIYGWSFNFTDGGFAENYLKCIVMLLKNVPYNGYIRKGIWLPNYTGTPKKGYACNIEYTCIKKLEKKYIPDLGNSLPDGGTTGQILTKNSDEDGDAGWKDAVQSNWDEKDESSPAFVKGRTHYTEYEKQLQFDYNAEIHTYTITSPVALDTGKTYELVFNYDIENDAVGQAEALIRRKVINPVTYKGSWLGKFTQKTKYGSTYWCFNNIHPADNSFLPCIYSSDMRSFTGYINNCIDNEAWFNEVKIAAPLDLKYIPETIARVSDTVMGTGEEQFFGSSKQKQICENIGALYLGDLSDYLSTKLDKNQGTANSGKFLGIGADGIVVPTEVSGGEKWELISHSDDPIENVMALKINLDDNGNAFQLKKAVLYVWCSVNGTYAYANMGKTSGYAWLCQINGSGQEKLYTVKYFKDVDGQWCIGANMVSYNTTTMLPTSQAAFQYGRRVADTTEYCDYIHFEKGSGASFAKYALYGVRK